MKAIYHIKVSLLTLSAMVACTEMEISNESHDSTNNGLLQELSITGKDFQFEDATRSSVTIDENGASFTWDEDDVIGIFPDKGDQVSFAMDEGAGTQTATFSGGGWALKSSAKYAAYYPHVYENRDLTAIPISYVGQTQNGNANTDHIGAYDFMAAGVSTPENGAVAFDMQHLGALVQLTITVPEPSALTKVVLTSSTEFTETGTIDLTANIPTINADTQSNTFEIALDNITTTEVNENVIVYFMLAPVDLTDIELTAKIHFADETINEVEITGKNFQAGKAYRLAIKIPTYYIDEYGINHGPGVEIDGVVWAPVNCGYHATDYKYGKLYQWGRKYGQGYDNSTIGILPDKTFPTSEDNTIQKGPVELSVGNDSNNSDIFYKGSISDTNYDWLHPQNDKLWNAGTEENPIKTEYDPCPTGWRVPTFAELELLSTKSSAWSTSDGQKGLWFTGTILYAENVSKVFFSAVGLRNNDGNAVGRGIQGGYWSSKPACTLFFYQDGEYEMNKRESRAYGYALRCVKE